MPLTRPWAWLFKRGIRIREYGAERDPSYLYAAYLKGAFPDAPEKMTRVDFLAQVDESTAGFQRHLAVADLPRGETPTGLFLTRDHGAWLEPHVFWFPWATKRVRMESAAAYLSAAAKDRPVLVFARPDSRAFFDRLALFGIVRPVGHVDGLYDDRGFLFQAVG